MPSVRRELIALLAEHEIVHPSAVVRITIDFDKVEVRVWGQAWWRGVDGYAQEDYVNLCFERVSEGCVPALLGGYKEDLDEFAISSLAAVGWAQPPNNDIYCQAPLPDPAALFMALESELSHAESFKRPADFLNQGDTLTSFARLAARPSYLLARAPEAISAVLVDELQRQRATYNVVTRPAGTEGRLWVRLKGASFLCTEAWAEFDA